MATGWIRNFVYVFKKKKKEKKKSHSNFQKRAVIQFTRCLSLKRDLSYCALIVSAQRGKYQRAVILTLVKATFS